MDGAQILLLFILRVIYGLSSFENGLTNTPGLLAKYWRVFKSDCETWVGKFYGHVHGLPLRNDLVGL